MLTATRLPCVPSPTGVAHAPIGGVGVTGSLYERVLATSKAEGVCFDFADCAGRVLRTLIAYYWLLIRFPISFSIFLVRYNMLWEGPVVGLLLTAFSLPFYPLAAMGLLLAKKLCGAGAYNPGNIFFTPPDDPLTSLLWDYYKVMSPPLSQFMLNRGDTVAVAHSWYDHITDKFFWRRHLEAVGARVPRQLGVWKELEGGKWGVEWSHPLKGEDIVIKIADESNGIGDAFLRNGSGEGMMGSEADVHAFLSAPFYTGRETLVLEWIRPAAGQEVHSLDVVTVATPDGGIELLTVRRAILPRTPPRGRAPSPLRRPRARRPSACACPASSTPSPPPPPPTPTPSAHRTGSVLGRLCGRQDDALDPRRLRGRRRAREDLRDGAMVRARLRQDGAEAHILAGARPAWRSRVGGPDGGVPQEGDGGAAVAQDDRLGRDHREGRPRLLRGQLRADAAAPPRLPLVGQPLVLPRQLELRGGGCRACALHTLRHLAQSIISAAVPNRFAVAR